MVKDIRRKQSAKRSQGRTMLNVRNVIRKEESGKRPFEEERYDPTYELTFPAIPRNQLMDEPIILKGTIEDYQVRRILVDGGSSSEIMYEHCFRNLSINVRSRLRRCRGPLDKRTSNAENKKQLRPRALSRFDVARKNMGQGIGRGNAHHLTRPSEPAHNGRSHIDRQLQAIINRRTPGKHRSIRMVQIRKNCRTTICHGAPTKNMPSGRPGGLQETTHDTRRKTGIERRGVSLAEGRTIRRVQHLGWSPYHSTGIKAKIQSHSYGDYKFEIKSVDAQESLEVAPMDNGYFVRIDMFRYIENNINHHGQDHAPNTQVIEDVAVLENYFPEQADFCDVPSDWEEHPGGDAALIDAAGKEVTYDSKDTKHKC
ncbi:reverse transcriptase domain-containing protein [Tanacetum coccineum]